LISWDELRNADDPPHAVERDRNDRVEALTHTRNVFTDRPDLVARIHDL
jgi:endonuclease I